MYVRGSIGVLLALAILIPRPASALQPHDRKSWLAGMGYGPARSKIVAGPALQNEAGDRFETNWEEGVSAQIRFGLSPPWI